MTSKCSGLLILLRSNPKYFTNREIMEVAGFRYSSRICELRKLGVEIDVFESEKKDGTWFYCMGRDNPAIIVKNGHIFDTSREIRKEVKEAVKT